jgi:hypothetical protein
MPGHQPVLERLARLSPDQLRRGHHAARAGAVCRARAACASAVWLPRSWRSATVASGCGRAPDGLSRDPPPALLEPSRDEPRRQAAQAAPARVPRPLPGALSRADEGCLRGRPRRARVLASRSRPRTPRPRPSTATGTTSSPSTTSRPSTGSTCARVIRSSRTSPGCGCARSIKLPEGISTHLDKGTGPNRPVRLTPGAAVATDTIGVTAVVATEMAGWQSGGQNPACQLNCGPSPQPETAPGLRLTSRDDPQPARFHTTPPVKRWEFEHGSPPPKIARR